MTSNVPQEKPHCDEIYAKSSLWALNESEMDIAKEMKVYLTTRIDEEDYFIYHIMETRFNVHLPKKNMMKNKSIDNIIIRRCDFNEQVCNEQNLGGEKCD